MVDNKVYPFAGQYSRNDQLVAGMKVGELRRVKSCAAARFECKLVFVVYETHIDSSKIGRVVMYDSIVPFG